LNPTTVQYEFTVDDISKSSALLSRPGTIYQRATAKSSVILWWLFLVFSFAAAALPSEIFAPEAKAFAWRVLSALLIMAFGGATMMAALRRLPGNHFDAIHKLGGFPHPTLRCTAELTEEGLTISNQAGHSLLRWDSMLAPVRHDLYLMYPSSALNSFTIPTRAFASPVELDVWWTESIRLFNAAQPKAPPQTAGPLGYSSKF
jgi:hypothetical protein